MKVVNNGITIVDTKEPHLVTVRDNIGLVVIKTKNKIIHLEPNQKYVIQVEKISKLN